MNPDNRHDKILEGWQLLKGTLGAAEGRTVGIVSKVDDDETKAYCVIRLDWDPTKRLHFNATFPYNSSKKRAACSNITVGEDNFLSQLNAIAGLDAQQIWTRWKSGNWFAFPPK